MNVLTFVEVCSGCGGLSKGLTQSGFQPLLLNDIDKDCCETLRLNHNNINVFCGDMLNIPNVDKYKDIDLLAGGIPCQPYSLSGQKKGLDDDRGRLVYSFVKLLDTLKPKVFLVENVKGLLLHPSFNDFLAILNSSNNYNITYKLLNSGDFGVPQKRERVFIVGVRKDINKTFVFPEPIKDKKLLKDVLINVPIEEGGTTYSQNKLRYVRKIPQGGCWVNLSEDEQKEYLGNSYLSPGGKRGILRRLSMNEQCLTLLCSPSQKQTDRIHPTEDRPLSIRESARIQTFPDTYKFKGGMTSQYKQIGNAVPVLLAERIGQEIARLLNQN